MQANVIPEHISPQVFQVSAISSPFMVVLGHSQPQSVLTSDTPKLSYSLICSRTHSFSFFSLDCAELMKNKGKREVTSKIAFRFKMTLQWHKFALGGHALCWNASIHKHECHVRF